MHYGGKKQLLWHHLMCVTVCVFWFVRTNVGRRRKSLNPLCRGLRGWGGSIIGLLPIHSLCHVTSAPHRLVELSPSRISIFSPPLFWTPALRTPYEVNSNHLSVQFRGCCPSYMMVHYRTHPTLPNQRERKGQCALRGRQWVAMMLVVVALVMK